MKVLSWIHVVLGLLAIGSGAIVLRGVLNVALSSNRVTRFLRYSLIASVAGLLPLTPHLSPIQKICMLSVTCSGAVVIAWREFHLSGPWRPIFAFFIVAVLYLNVVTVWIRLFKNSPLFAIAATESGARFDIAQLFVATVFAVLGVLAVRTCRPHRAYRH